MSFTLGIDDSDLRKLERNLLIFGQAGRKASLRGRIKTAHRIEKAAKRRVPVDEGTLKNSIHVDWEEGPASVAVGLLAAGAARDEVAVLTDEPYATRQEFEHEGRAERRRGGVVIQASSVSKKGFMRKSAAENRANVARDVADELKKALR